MDATEQFLASVLPSRGPYVLAYNTPATAGMTHKCFQTIPSLVSASIDLSSKYKNVYYCISAIGNEHYVDHRGKISPRCQKNCIETRSLILDIDIDEANERKYETQELALLGLHNFCQVVGLPEPSVVSSGYGFHVYWAFETAIPSTQWAKTARDFKAVATFVDKKLVADASRVADCASLLRIPNTKNYKAEPRDVNILSLSNTITPYANVTQVLDKFQELHHIISQVEFVKSDDSEKKEELPQTTHDFNEVIKKCQWVQNYLRVKTTASEPEWYATLGVVKHAPMRGKTIEETALFVSAGHPGYSVENTLRKLQHVTESQEGPTLCKRFESLNAAWCAGCPYIALVRTPARLDCVDIPAPQPVILDEVLNASGEIEVVATPIPNPPKPYFRGVHGGIYINGEETAKRIYEYDLYPIRRLRDEETENENLEMSLTLPQDGTRIIKIPTGLLTDQKKFTSALADKGVYIHLQEIRGLMGYIVEYARLIQRESRAQEEFARFGWRDLNTTSPRFVFGDVVMDKLGKLSKSTIAPYLKPLCSNVSAKGALDQWKEAFNAYKGTNYHAYKFMLMLGFAAPLFALTPFNGLIFNIVGESGSGKSTALELMTSIWGEPKKNHINVQDNKIPMFNTIGYMQNLPVSFDEITQINADYLADIAYAISEGRGKNRADTKGDTRINKTHWKTIVCATSNTSLYEKLGMAKVGNNAHAYRIFEVSVGKAKEEFKAQLDAAVATVKHHHGLAGRVYMSYVIPHIDKITTAIAQLSREYAALFKMNTAERYWYGTFANIAVGNNIARDLGLHDYDPYESILWAVKQLGSIRQTVRAVEGDPISLLGHFLQTNLRETVHVHDEAIHSFNADYPTSALNVRIEFTNKLPKRAYIAEPAIKEHCKRANIDLAWFTRTLSAAGVLVDGAVPIKLGKGTALVTTTVRSWEIDLTHPLLADAGVAIAAHPLASTNVPDNVMVH